MIIEVDLEGDTEVSGKLKIVLYFIESITCKYQTNGFYIVYKS